jgi:anaerobic selenocysteine-containing dehydrogenase
MKTLADLAAVPMQPPAEDALLLIGRRDIRSNNSWMHNAPRLVKGPTRHELWMHADDLDRRKLSDGHTVRVRSQNGSIAVAVKVSNAVRPGVVCLPHGFGHQRVGLQLRRAEAVTGPSYNDLTGRTALDGPSGNAALNGVPVWVEAL